MFIEIEEILQLDFSQLGPVRSYHLQAVVEHLIGNPNDSYRVDRSDALKYFGIAPKWRQKISDLSSRLKAEQKEFCYVDICGRASGARLGATQSYLFSLKTNKMSRLFHPTSDIFVDGSIFNSRDFSRLVRHIRSGGVRPSFITFMPMAGLQSHSPLFGKHIPNFEAITYAILASRLVCMLELLLPGGFIMLERPFQFDGSFAEAFSRTPQNKYKLSLALKKLARKCKCRIEILSELGGPYFLIHKPLT